MQLELEIDLNNFTLSINGETVQCIRYGSLWRNCNACSIYPGDRIVISSPNKRYWLVPEVPLPGARGKPAFVDSVTAAVPEGEGTVWLTVICVGLPHGAKHSLSSEPCELRQFGISLDWRAGDYVT